MQLYLKPVHTSRASWRAVQASRFAVRRFCAPASVTLGAALVLLLEAPSVTAAQTPLSYLSASGARAYPINSLLWALLAISVAVIVMSIVLLLLGILRGNALPGNALPGRLMIERPGRGIGWIVVGVGASTAVLFGAAVWTVVTLAAVSSPPGGHADLHLEVTGHQWWWEVLYKDPSPNLTFKTANEIHIPVDRNVSVDLRTADVIHSFWVPSLTGKTDLIPGQINQTWFSASRPGVYRGQCTEYCGRQHAHMALEVVADDPGAFKAWRDHALQPVAAPVSVEGAGDLDAFVRRCGACHAVAGTRAGGILGPDLSHLMSRHTIAAGALPNSIGHLSAWIADPQHIKPGAYMPRLDVSGPELTRIRRFLLTLQ